MAKRLKKNFYVMRADSHVTVKYAEPTTVETKLWERLPDLGGSSLRRKDLEEKGRQA